MEGNGGSWFSTCKFGKTFRKIIEAKFFGGQNYFCKNMYQRNAFFSVWQNDSICAKT